MEARGRKRVLYPKYCNRLLGLLVPLATFIVICSLWIKLIPFAGSPLGAPDEVTHYKYNVEYIINHHRFPVTGRDDLSAYMRCHENPHGLVPCVISYEMYPGLNYGLSAITAKLANHFLHWPLYMGSRLASLFWGIIFIIFLYLCLELVTDWKAASVITFAFGLNPQIIFIASYINQDIHSLAISAMLAYATARLAIRGYTRWNVILFALMAGFILSAKYNYFVFLPAVVVAVLIIGLRQRWSRLNFLVLAAASAAGALLISGYWYIRNLYYLHDLLGQSYMVNLMSHYHKLGSPEPFSLNSIGLFAKQGFFAESVHSFIGMFGYMAINYPDGVYEIAEFTALTLLVFIITDIWRRRCKDEAFALAAFTIFSLMVISLFIYNSLHYDYQPQGRYLFPLVVPGAIILGYLVRKERNFLKYGVVSTALTSFLILEAMNIFVGAYIY